MLSPWLLSTMMASTPAATRARTRSRSSGRVPTAAATMRLLFLSFVARGKSAFFFRSVRATRAMRRCSAVTIGNFPFFDLFKRSLALFKSTPSCAVTRSLRGVMICVTLVLERSFTKSVSRFVTKPMSLEPITPSSVTGKPVKPADALSLSSSSRVIVGEMQTGSMMKPLSNFFTLRTSRTCASTGKFVWMTPMPPSNAIAMAIRDSVTVSIGLDTIGVRNGIFREKRESKTTSCTPKSMHPGKHMRSS
mmetsp:Transcript_127763/g.272479  ORF Transcript_127763/g.272479 Transcript_127763/m.272479 type:complete len:249 (-) Transcript_127763:283-1029(-)